MDTAFDDVLDEIDQRAADLRAHAHASDVSTQPPLLVLGTRERVDSNRPSDTPRPAMAQRNEVPRQQWGGLHLLSPVNSYGMDGEQVPRARLGALGWHGLATFVAAKYAPVRRLAKDTNLLFTALVPMPSERGGRIYWSPEYRNGSVNPVCAHHLVYWVTRIDAAVFTAVNSARPAMHGELRVPASDAESSNHDHALRDITPVAHAAAPHRIHQPVGSVRVRAAASSPNGDGPEGGGALPRDCASGGRVGWVAVARAVLARVRGRRTDHLAAPTAPTLLAAADP